MQRIGVTPSGIRVTVVVEPVVSAFGKVMRAGAMVEQEIPWEEIAAVELSDVDGLEIDLTYGEFVTVGAAAEGYAETVAELERRGMLTDRRA